MQLVGLGVEDIASAYLPSEERKKYKTSIKQLKQKVENGEAENTETQQTSRCIRDKA